MAICIASQAGAIGRDILLPETARYELIDFMAAELPRWRDHPDRHPASAETTLTSQLCDHLNGAAYYSTTWSHIQFRTEVPDEVASSRKTDLAAKPLGASLVIEGRRHSQFDTLLPIECKRLPTPQEKDRDEREYVTSEHGTTGGIQRFKLGLHGAAHRLGAMIGYVQDQTCSYWLGRVNSWIVNLAEVDSSWTDADILRSLNDDSAVGLCVLRSHHRRDDDLEDCELRHVWIRMANGPVAGRSVEKDCRHSSPILGETGTSGLFDHLQAQGFAEIGERFLEIAVDHDAVPAELVPAFEQLPPAVPPGSATRRAAFRRSRPCSVWHGLLVGRAATGRKRANG